ncbi:MAG: hypothetical protein JO092_00940, partial [Candidatus Eremiobacteraeota bacterium]|nr:hypothetical protein [Candidatus Eremiobacteraeota bacterium]
MKQRRLMAAIAALALAGAAPSARAATSVPSPVVEDVDGSTIVRQPDDHVSLVGVALVVRSGLDRQTIKQNGLAALVAETILHTPVPVSDGRTLLPLDEAVAAGGGSIRYTVDPADVRFYIEALAGDAPAVLDLVRGALAAPDFNPDTVRSARSALVGQI